MDLLSLQKRWVVIKICIYSWKSTVVRQACSSQILSICQTQQKITSNTETAMLSNPGLCWTSSSRSSSWGWFEEEKKSGSHSPLLPVIQFTLTGFYSFATAPCLSKCTWESALAQVRLASRMICNNIGQRTLILDSKFSILGTGGNPRFNNCLWYSEVRPSSTIQLLSQYVTFHHFDLPNPTKRANCADPKYI